MYGCIQALYVYDEFFFLKIFFIIIIVNCISIVRYLCRKWEAHWLIHSTGLRYSMILRLCINTKGASRTIFWDRLSEIILNLCAFTVTLCTKNINNRIQKPAFVPGRERRLNNFSVNAYVCISPFLSMFFFSWVFKSII